MGHAPSVLVIAGCDSSGGAGLVRDVRTLEALGVDALCAVTAVTAQTDSGVLGVHTVPPAQVRAQIQSAFATRSIAAVKIGMLAERAIVEAVADALVAARTVPVVLDPVLRASSGGALLEPAATETLRTRLYPLTTVLTPNIPEAAHLAGATVTDAPEAACLLEWARRIAAQGVGAVLIKGGHAAGAQALDVLVRPGHEPLWLTAPRLARGRRGTGCALSSALAAGLAEGADLDQACRAAHAHVRRLLEQAQTDAPRRAQC